MSLAISPTYPVPGRQARITFGFASGAANYMRVWCTQAPSGSELQNRIDKARLSRALVYEGDGGAGYPWRTTFDKGGAYTLVIQEYAKGNAWGGGYEGDPRGAPTETKIGAEYASGFHVAQRLTHELGAGDDKATLVLYVVSSTIRQTFGSVHGEDSPAIIDPTSDRARTASKTALVTAAAAALVDMPTTTAVGSLGSVTNNLIAKFAAHADTGTYHQGGDDQSDLSQNYAGATSLAGIAKALNKVRTRLGQHMLNSKETDPANPQYALPGGFEIHNESSTFFDLKNTLLPITADDKNPATIFQAIGDFWRAYEAHRTAVMHETSDTANTLTALPQLLETHHQFVASLAAISPTAEPGQSLGAVRLIGLGFEES